MNNEELLCFARRCYDLYLHHSFDFKNLKIKLHFSTRYKIAVVYFIDIRYQSSNMMYPIVEIRSEEENEDQLYALHNCISPKDYEEAFVNDDTIDCVVRENETGLRELFLSKSGLQTKSSY